MDVTLLTAWLGLPPGPWPPDHYALLGLTPADADPARVEAHVLERMDRLRPRQLVHPELVTEGMNRLAQALVVLTDPAAKAAYDTRFGPAPPSPPPAPEPRERRTSADVVHDAPVVVPVPLPDWDDDPDDDDHDPPADATVILEVPFSPGLEPPISNAAEMFGSPPEVPLPLPPEFVPPPFTVMEDALPAAVPVAPPPGRRWVYTRLAAVRKTLRAWESLRSTVGDADERADGPAGVLALLMGVRQLRPLLPEMEGIVGGPDGPGEMVTAVVRQPLAADTLRTLQREQRDALAHDWRRGRLALEREQHRLRDISRRKPAAGGLSAWLWRLARSPEVWLAAAGLFALAVAWVRELRRG